MNVVAYYRLRTTPKAGFPDLPAQRDAVRRKLSAAPSQSFTEAERGRRGGRPELEKALAACREQRAMLVVATMDGLSRDRHFLRALADAGVMVGFCDFPVPDGAGGRFMLQMMAQVAELEAGLASRRTKAAHQTRIDSKGPWDRNARHRLVPGAGQAAAVKALRQRADARAAEVIALIRPLADEGMTLTAIAEALNARKVPTARGGRWTATAVKRVLERAG